MSVDLTKLSTVRVCTRSLLYIPTEVLTHIVGPLAWRYAELIPSIRRNCTLATTASVMCVVTYVQTLSKCSLRKMKVCRNVLQPAFLTHDDTSNTYSQSVFQQILQETYDVSAVFWNLMIYPLLFGLQFLQASHCLVNIPLSSCYTAVAAIRPCEYLKVTGDSSVEHSAGCTLDFLPIVSIWIEMVRSQFGYLC